MSAVANQQTVSQFEYDLLRIARGLLSDAPITASVQQLLSSEVDPPPCLSETAIEVLKDMIRKGVVAFFARRGWRRETYLRDETPATGRVWDRTKPEQLGLTFSVATVEWMFDLTSRDIAKMATWKGRGTTLGDRVFFLIAGRALSMYAVATKPWNSKFLTNDGLFSLACLNKLGANRATQFNFEPWVQGAGAAMFECLQRELAKQWTAVEQQKRVMHSKDDMQRIGIAQADLLRDLMAAVEKHQRWDLCRFVLNVVDNVVHESSESAHWIGSLQMGNIRLADRAKTYDAATSVLNAFSELGQWTAQSQGIGYFDEGYQSSQVWKAFWEEFDGDRKLEIADGILREIRF